MKISKGHYLLVITSILTMQTVNAVPMAEVSAQLNRESQQHWAHQSQQHNSDNSGGLAYGAGAYLGDMFAAAYQRQQIKNAKIQKEYNLGPIHPNNAKYSKAKALVNGKTLAIDTVKRVYFDKNGIAAYIAPGGLPKVSRWFVSADQVCLGSNSANVSCLRFNFNNKRELSGIKTNNGGVFDTFQIIDADIAGLSQLTQSK